MLDYLSRQINIGDMVAIVYDNNLHIGYVVNITGCYCTVDIRQAPNFAEQENGHLHRKVVGRKVIKL